MGNFIAPNIFWLFSIGVEVNAINALDKVYELDIDIDVPHGVRPTIGLFQKSRFLLNLGRGPILGFKKI